MENARDLFLSGMNCAQAVLCAFSEELGLERETALKISEGMGGGMGRMRLTCGAVSAMAMIAGLKLGSGKADDSENKREVYEAVQKMAKEFEEKNGSVICGELLGSALPKNSGPRPEARTKEYYKKRPCSEYVADCAEIVKRTLFDSPAEA